MKGFCSRCNASNVEVVQIFNNKIDGDTRKTINVWNYQEGRYICRKCLGDPDA